MRFGKYTAVDANVGRWPRAGSFSLLWLWRGVHTEVGRLLGFTRNTVVDLGCDHELVCNEPVLSREIGPGIHTG